MSDPSDSTIQLPGTSFWEPGNFKKTTRRIDNGFKLSNDLISLVQERSDIEKAYAKSLKDWSKQGQEILDKGPEYGTTAAAWRGMFKESDRICDLHLKMKDNLNNKVIQSLKAWQKETYHKSLMHIREKKEMEEAFKAIQKPWVKLLAKVSRAKNFYHTACKNERLALNHERDVSADSFTSLDELRRMQDKVMTAREDVQMGKESYKFALRQLNSYSTQYSEEMTALFERCQELEAKRLRFFKEMLMHVYESLNISQESELPRIYQDFYETVVSADSEKDLNWWSTYYGAAMQLIMPQFEEYIDEGSSKSKESISKGKKLPVPSPSEPDQETSTFEEEDKPKEMVPQAPQEVAVGPSSSGAAQPS